jgi:hypothetical protein
MSDECTWCKKKLGSNMSDNAIELASEIRKFNNLHNFMQDDQLDKAMRLVVKLTMNPEVPSAKAPALIVELQSLATIFAARAAEYATFNSGPARSVEAHKKNVYFSMKEAITKLVDALKYAAKAEMDYR